MKSSSELLQTQPMFLLNHSLWWRRGLGGPIGNLVLSSPYNVGQALGVSPSAIFAAMLGSQMKCSFSLTLYVNVKTNNGFGTLDSRDDWDYAAFALEDDIDQRSSRALSYSIF